MEFIDFFFVEWMFQLWAFGLSNLFGLSGKFSLLFFSAKIKEFKIIAFDFFFRSGIIEKNFTKYFSFWFLFHHHRIDRIFLFFFCKFQCWKSWWFSFVEVEIKSFVATEKCIWLCNTFDSLRFDSSRKGVNFC